MSRNEKGKIMSNEEQNKFDFGGHMVNLEDAENASTPTGDKTFSDQELESAGLIKTSAFVRSKRSKNALRVQKNKEKKAEQGIKQLNVEVPEQHRDLMKQLAIALKEGKTPQEAIKSVLTDADTPKAPKTSQNGSQSVSEEKQKYYATIGQKVAEIQSQGGFKGWLLNRLI